MKKLLLCVALVVSTYCLSQTAVADVIGSWNYEVDANITGYMLGTGTSAKYYTAEDHVTLGNDRNGKYGNYSSTSNGGYSYLVNTDTGSKLSWGEGTRNGYQWSGYTYSQNASKTSSISIEGLGGNYEIGKDSIQAAATFKHVNQAISGNVLTPSIIDIALSFTFNQVVPEGEKGLSLPVEVKLHMGFYETTNSGDYQDDIFYFINPFDSITEMQIEGSDYYVALFSTFKEIDQVEDAGYYNLAAARLLADPDSGWQQGDAIWGWITKEGSTTENAKAFTISFSITEDYPEIPGASTPEPATMLIFGLAAAGGLPFALRRRMNKNRK